MKNKLIIILIIFAYSFIWGQTKSYYDSLYNVFVKNNKYLLYKSGTPNIEKCSFGINGKIKVNFSKFTTEQQSEIIKLSIRPEKQNSVVSPSGYFRVHYNSTGSDVPAYDLNELLKALDSTYNFEVNYLKYISPPSDGTNGGDEKYDVYISDIGSNGHGIYGSTQFEDYLIDNKYTSFMLIDNDYSGYNSPGILGAKVTVAHEFHHAIQIGSYIYRDSDNPFYEMTSTSMEDFVFESINDYINYLGEYFNNPNHNLYGYDGYSYAIWNIYLKTRFNDYAIIRKQWELMPQMSALDAIDFSIKTYNSNYRHELNQFGVWCYFTNFKSVTGKYFPDAQLYPAIKPMAVLKLINKSISANLISDAAANTFFCIKDSLTNDTLFVIATNSDVRLAVDSSSSYIPFTYLASKDSIPHSVKLSSNLFVDFQCAGLNVWTIAEILNKQIVRQDNFTIASGDNIKGDFPFPNPFYYSKFYVGGNYISIPAYKSNSEYANVNIYSSGMDLVFSSNLPVTQLSGFTDKYIVQWDGKTIDSKKLASGVYIYIVKSDNKNSKGKLVIFNGK